MDKYNRNYRLEIGTGFGLTLGTGENQDLSLVINRPFTVEFDIHRNSFSSANVGSIRIYNLNETHRAQIRKNQFDYGDLREISFSAGYGDQLSLAFKGNISQAWSVREGTNFISQIESYDGGFAYTNAVTDISYPSGTPQETLIGSFIRTLPGVQFGAIGSFKATQGTIPRGNAYSGSTVNILKDVTNGNFFIDNGKAYVISQDEQYLRTKDVPLVNVQSGLLGTPVKEQTFITFEMLFEPSLRIGQLVELQSQSADHFNGVHKVILIKHRGVISEAVAGTAITTVGLLPGSFLPVEEGEGSLNG